MIKTEISEDSELFLAMLREGVNGDLSAFSDALKILHEIEEKGSSAVLDFRENPVSRAYDEENFRTAHEYS